MKEPRRQPRTEQFFASALKTRRQQLGLSQKDVADIMSRQGVPFHHNTVCQIENGVRRISLTDAFVLADILDTTPWSLVAQGRARYGE